MQQQIQNVKIKNHISKKNRHKFGRKDRLKIENQQTVKHNIEN